MRRPVIFLINLYRNYISPFKLQTCRFYPTCSQYALEAIGKNGFLKGSLLSFLRLLKCHPLNKGGYDPVR